MPRSRKKMLFVYNPRSGRGEIANALSDILVRLTSAGYDITVHPTLSSKDGQGFIAKHGNEFDIVVSSGGDGMLHEHFAGMMAGNVTVPCGYIPAGTVNDFASSLMISKVPIEAVETIVNGKFKAIDVGTFNDSVFSYVAAFGLFTKVSYSTDQNMKNALGFLAYLIEILKSMDLKHFHEASVHAKISINDKEYEDDFIFGFAGNTLSVGGLTTLIPTGAEMDDGLLDFMFVKTPKTLFELDKIRQALMTKKLDIPEIICDQAGRAVIETARAIEWTLDGEYGGKCDHVELGILNKVVQIAVP